jgi:predicted patatin/cPLA2 family phospholipase
MGKLAYPEFPMVAEVWTARQNIKYSDALDLMKNPPAGVRIRVFRPMRPMPVGSFTAQKKLISAALTLGHDEAVLQMENMDSGLALASIPG